MKKSILYLAACIILLTGCGNNDLVSNQQAADDNNSVTGMGLEAAPDLEYTTTDLSGVKGSGIESELKEKGDIIEIKEKMFIAQTNDIYYNPEDYLGKTIKYEGIFDVYMIPATGEKIYSVIRYGPGCCVIDESAGFEVMWDKEYPNENDWVEVVGTLEQLDYEGMNYLCISISSLTVKQERGAEYVAQ